MVCPVVLDEMRRDVVTPIHNETRAIHYCVRFHTFLYSRKLLVAHAISSGRALQVHEC